MDIKPYDIDESVNVPPTLFEFNKSQGEMRVREDSEESINSIVHEGMSKRMIYMSKRMIYQKSFNMNEVQRKV